MKRFITIIISTVIILASLSSLLTARASMKNYFKTDVTGPSGTGTSGPGTTGSGNTSLPTDLTDGTFPVNEVLTLDNGEQPKKYFEDKENSPVVSFILEIIDFATTIMGSIAVLLLIAAGFMFMMAHGNQQSLEKAKELVKYAVIGLIVAFLSYIIVVSVQSIFVAD